MVGAGTWYPGVGCPPYKREPAMNKDRTAKVYAGQMGVLADSNPERTADLAGLPSCRRSGMMGAAARVATS